MPSASPSSSISSATVLPSSHPPITGSSLNEKLLTCPVTGKSYKWRPAQEGDSRSPCPALNTMANHGYIPRSGKGLSVFQLISGLKACYSLSTPLATFLSFGGFLLLHRVPMFQKIDLHDVGRHGRVEHDASLVHDDTPPGQKYAPIKVEDALVDALIADATNGEDGSAEDGYPVLMDATDVARARIRRENESPALDAVHAEIARGEMAIILGVLETRLTVEEGKATRKTAGVPVEWIREWIRDERLPEGWKATHTQSLLNTMKRSSQIRKAMEMTRAKESVKV